MKIAMIGAGWVAGRHLSVLSAEPGVEVVGHVTPDAAGREAAAKRWGGRAYADVETLLKNETVEAAWIGVPPGAHGAIETALLERGIPIFVEKPLSADRATGEQIAELAARRNVIAAVGYHWRAMDTLPAVREALRAHPARMALGSWHDSTPPPMWWRHQATSGGQMVEQATHVVDLARTLLGEGQVRAALASRQPRAAYPTADVADVSAALVYFPGETVGVFSATCVLGGPASIQLQLVCEGLLVSITQTVVTYDYGREKHEYRATADPFLTEDRAFMEAVRQNSPAPLYCSYADALLTHRLCHDILERSQS